MKTYNTLISGPKYLCDYRHLIDTEKKKRWRVVLWGLDYGKSSGWHEPQSTAHACMNPKGPAMLA